MQRPWPGRRRYARRLLVGTALLATLVPLQAIHWLCLALDEVLFPAYRRVRVRAPVFVLGTPRSGTTFLHRLLAHDPVFTTFALWECVLAPSVLERRALGALARLDRRVGAPFGRAVARIERRVARAMDDLHPTALSAPEEDYLALAPSFECFLLAIAFPEGEWLWRGARLDERPAAERAAFAARYRRVLQRHLYAHGEVDGDGRRLLSKNAVFAGAAHTLLDAFPDARVLVCRREPLDALDSQARVLAGARRRLGTDGAACGLDARLVDAFAYWNANLGRLGDAEAGLVVPVAQLSRHTREIACAALQHLNLPMSNALDAALAAHERKHGPHGHGFATPHRAADAPSADPDVRARFARAGA